MPDGYLLFGANADTHIGIYQPTDIHIFFGPFIMALFVS